VLDNQAFTGVQKDITGFARTTSFWLTDTNDALMLNVSENFFLNPPSGSANRLIMDLKLIDKNHARTTLPTNLNSKIYDFSILSGGWSSFLKPTDINNGWVYFENFSIPNHSNVFSNAGFLAAYNINSGLETSMQLSNWVAPVWNISYFRNNGILIEYRNGKIYIISIKNYLKKLYSYSGFSNNQSNRWTINVTNSIIEFATSADGVGFNVRNENIFLDYIMVLEDVGMENGEIIRFGVDGNTTYDLILEEVNGELTLVPYVKGTYVAPPPTTITFQPINR